MNYVKIYVDALYAYKRLSDTEFGRAIRALLQYVEDGTEANLPGKESIMFDVLREQVKRGEAAYETKVNNGKKGGRPRKTEENRKNLPVISETEENRKNQYKEKEYIPPYNPPTGDNDEDELLAISARHQDVFDKAKDCGFTANTADLDRLTDLIASHGPDAVLDALDACVESQAVNFRYLRAVLGGKPKEQPSQLQYQRLYP